ncbi:MAG: class I SAM-dependent methyltransferase [bacterium]
MKISKRLEALSKEVIGFNTVCDVGCDHGLFSIYSILYCGIKHAYLLDINQEPLNSAKNNFIKYKLSNATFLLSDGLKDFNEQLDCLVISGIGGYLMTRILQDDLDKIKLANKLILQPNSDFEILRKFLLENNFEITFENMLLDNKKYCYYLTAINKKTSFNEEDVLFGPILRKDINEVYFDYWNSKYINLNNELNKIKDDNNKIELNKKINSIKENIIIPYTK